jgi:hypothetical protein
MLRALNHWRHVYVPTYLGLRRIGESAVVRHNDPWLPAVVERKGLARRTPRYRTYMALKNIDVEGHLEYRTFHAASPTTALMEAWALGCVAGLDSFAVPRNVYSYRWPRHARGARSYQYFVDGFRERCEVITHWCGADSEAVLVLADVRKFYPTVNRERVRQRWMERLERADVESGRMRTVLSILDGYLSIERQARGIAMGPALSHVCGHIAMADVDATLRGKWGSRYIRYVDDIAIVCRSSQAQEALTDVNRALASEELEGNAAKQAVVPGAVWESEGRVLPRTAWRGSVGGIFLRTAVYVGLHGDRAQERVASLFREHNVWLPVRRLALLSRTSGFRAIAARLVRAIARPVDALRETPQSLLNDAQALRTKFVGDLEAELEKPVAGHLVIERWRTQRVRYALQQLLYLLSPREYGPLVAMVERRDGVEDIVAVMRGLITGDLKPVLRMPGGPVAAFAALWVEQGRERVGWKVPAESDEVERDALATLFAYGVIGLTTNDPGLRDGPKWTILGALRAPGNPPQAEDAPTYEDELAWLMGDGGPETGRQLLSSRFDAEEGTTLEALSLLPSIYS